MIWARQKYSGKNHPWHLLRRANSRKSRCGRVEFHPQRTETKYDCPPENGRICGLCLDILGVPR